LYKLTEIWKNNMECQLFEIEFPERLIETFFVKLLLQENLDTLRELQNDLFQAKNGSKDLQQHIQIHLDHIVDLLDEPFKYKASIFRQDHEQLEDDVSEFISMQKTIRFTVFKMTKDVLESEKPKFIWKYN